MISRTSRTDMFRDSDHVHKKRKCGTRPKSAPAAFVKSAPAAVRVTAAAIRPSTGNPSAPAAASSSSSSLSGWTSDTVRVHSAGLAVMHKRWANCLLALRKRGSADGDERRQQEGEQLRCVGKLAALAQCMGRYEAAAAYQREHLVLAEGIWGKEDTRVADSMLRLAF